MAKVKPTDSELEILQVLWTLEVATVREVNEYLNNKSAKEIGYTTTLKLMQLMLNKELLKRDTSTRTHVYSAVVEEKVVKGRLLNQFVNKTFKGSAAQMVLAALGQHEASQGELDEIKQLIKKMENKDK